MTMSASELEQNLFIRYHTVDGQRIPIVSLAALRSRDEHEKRALAEALGAVCRYIGYFYVEHHGVSDILLTTAERAVNQFFDLPSADKMAIHISKSPFHRGYVPSGEENAYGSAIKDIKEVFDMALELAPDDPDVLADKFFHGYNAWPDAMPQLRSTMLWLYREWQTLCENISELFAIALGLPNGYFCERSVKPLAQLRAARYPQQPMGDTGGAIGCGAHTDYGIVSVIWQTDVAGLEICDAQGNWFRAPRIPGTFTCPLGDAIGIWTNDHWRATPHRVVNLSGETRNSLAFFFDPDHDCVIEPLPQFVSADTPARYAPTTMGKHVARGFDDTFEYRRQASAAEAEAY
ncbi:MAG TPA: 2-oxoglutarate and iron-dependent oxygenase domain-containing protein [Paraburkholderia sp.]|uniref:isopenicillin N synthase family dioxygenase n=1 Tax=Paraburkholderia sp. TaxID=1926495 RepID=UPI002ED25696